MPVPYVRKLARKHGTTTRRAEGKWAKAKASAASEGKGDNYAYITSIFKNMMHESPYIPTLKDLTRGMSFKYFIVAENDVPKEHSMAWKHLEKFPQFNELPFRARREIEKEVQTDGLIDDYEMLAPEEKESVDDALLDIVIDKMQAHFGTGVNVGDWSSTDHSDEEAPEDELAGVEEPEHEPAPRRRAERAPRHIAAMRMQHATEPEVEKEPKEPRVGARKSYYKPWAALSDEQRQGRAALAAKHGKLYRVKNSKWFRLLSPEKQQQVVDAVKAGHPVPTLEGIDWEEMKKHVDPKEMRKRVIKGGGNPFKNRLQKRMEKKTNEAMDLEDMKKEVDPKEMRKRVIKAHGNPFNLHKKEKKAKK